MSKPFALALAVALRGLGSACGAADVAALFQSSLVRHTGPTHKFQVGDKVVLEGYGPEHKATVLGYSHAPGRYHIQMDGGEDALMNQAETDLKLYKAPYAPSEDPEAGPIKYIVDFRDQLPGAPKPYIVRRGKMADSWDVYFPDRGMLPNIPNKDIVREPSWYKNRGHPEKSRNGAAAVLSGKMPGKMYDRSTADAKEATIIMERKPENVAPPNLAKNEDSLFSIIKNRKVKAVAAPPQSPVIKQERKPEISAAAPIIKERKPEISAAAPIIKERKPEISAAAPIIKERKPEISAAAPIIKERKHEISAAAPIIKERKPEISAAAPIIKERKPEIPAGAPIVKERKPKTPAGKPQARLKDLRLRAMAQLEKARMALPEEDKQKREAVSFERKLEDPLDQVEEETPLFKLPQAPLKTAGTQRWVDIAPESSGTLGFTYKVSTGAGKIKLKESTLLVDTITPGGNVDKWTKAHPKQRFAVGDKILQVNGKGGNAYDLKRILDRVSAASSPDEPVRLLVDNVKMPVKQQASAAFDTVKKVMAKGPRQFAREAIPYGMGKVFINSKEQVTKCKDISSQLYCGNSQKMFNIKCGGWNGRECLAPDEVTCGKLMTASLCKASMEKFGIECVGWGGSACLAKGAHPSQITSPEICEQSRHRLGIIAAGWGGDACLSEDAKCSEITVPGLCNNAAVKLGLSCLGWGGSTCLDRGSSAELITSEPLCKHAVEKFGIDAAGWGGSSCIDKKAMKCNMVTDPNICKYATDRLNLDCAGWGGSSCLDVGAAPNLITSPSICGKSVNLLSIPSGGWSGSACLPAGPVKCSAITHPGVCNDAAARLGIDCAGWAGAECLAPEEAKCNKIAVRNVCEKSVLKLGIHCVWNSGGECLPDTSRKEE